MSPSWIYVRCPVLTLFLDKGVQGVDALPWEVAYHGVHWDYVKELRIIVTKLPAWLEKTAQRESSSERIVDIQTLATKILAPVILPVPIPMTIYLFQDWQQHGAGELERMTPGLERESARRDEQALQRAISKGDRPRPPRPGYKVKTLSYYIAEGLEDEMIWQELKYWREENARRLKRNGNSLGNEHV